MEHLVHTSPFVKIRHPDERGIEYWSVRGLGKLLGYSSLLLYTYDFNLQKVARETKVAKPEDFALFFYHGYMGLFE